MLVVRVSKHQYIQGTLLSIADQRVRSKEAREVDIYFRVGS